jgi:DNA 3'-phosphatase
MNFNITEINNDPMGFIKKHKKNEIIALLMKADEAFFNESKDLIKDDVYDIIKDYIRTKYPKDKYLKRVGADVKNKVVLPYYMGSQNKIKDSEEEITKYQAKYPGSYTISDKLDGVSCLIVYTPGKIKMYTRGNGTEGQDISHLMSYVKEILPAKNENDIQIYGLSNKEFAVRGELIISKENWEELGKMGKQGANPRNTVAGAINSDILKKDILSKIDFVAYSLIHPELKDGLNKLEEMGFKVAYNTVASFLNLASLSKILETRRAESEYVIDGIVIEDNSKLYKIEKGKNPEHSFAFKSIHTLEQVEVIVCKVEWNVSKDMYMKPIVMFNEIDLDGVKIKQATGFNAAYIVKNVIGPGSRIIIVRSGNVIPFIQSVLTPSANGKPSMPGVEGDNYKWNDTHVDILMVNNEGDKNRDYDIKNLMYFMKTANIENMGPGNIAKIYDAGFDDIKKISNITKEDLLKIDGFKEKSAQNIIDALSALQDIDCLILMDASNIMGRGFSYKKIKLITDIYPSILFHDKKSRVDTSKLTVEDLLKVDGIAETSAKLFLNNLPKFYDFYDNLGIKCKSPANAANAANAAAPSVINTNILGKTFVFTGFRNKSLEEYIISLGGFIKTSISKNTDYLVVADLNENNSKTEKANSLGIPIILPNNKIFDKKVSPVITSPTPPPPKVAKPLKPLKQPKEAKQLKQLKPKKPVPVQEIQHIFKEQTALQAGNEERVTLITFQDHFRPTKGKEVKVIFADLDHTLITPKGKYVFPKTLDDWKWKNEAVVPKLKEMYNMGYEIIIITNQKKMPADDVRTKAKMIYDDLQIPFVFVSGHSDLYYRKPQLGLWEILIEYLFKEPECIDPASIFLGDSVADLYFARNTNIKFIHTDMFFLGTPNKEFAKIEEKEHPLTKWMSKTVQSLPSFNPSVKHLVVMVGSPASGKSFYSRDLEKKGFLRINKDEMKADKVQQKAFNTGLREGQNIVIDNTNSTKESRAKWINEAKEASYNITIVWMNFPMHVVEFLDNYRVYINKNQDTHVPAVAMRVYYKKFEKPMQEECDNLIEINTINKEDMLSVWL